MNPPARVMRPARGGERKGDAIPPRVRGEGIRRRHGEARVNLHCMYLGNVRLLPSTMSIYLCTYVLAPALPLDSSRLSYILADDSTHEERSCRSFGVARLLSPRAASRRLSRLRATARAHDMVRTKSPHSQDTAGQGPHLNFSSSGSSSSM